MDYYKVIINLQFYSWIINNFMLYFKSKKIKIYIKTKKAIKDCLIFEAVFYLKVNNYTTLINTILYDKIN